MKIAIHSRKDSFSDRWIDYCRKNNVNYRVVDCYKSDIIDQMSDCDGLMWHWMQDDPKAKLFARQLSYSLESIGKKMFPDSKTCWHFDDKIGQKYLLEALDAPLVPTYIFYDRNEALKWVGKTHFPKVFKLSTGAGSANVRLAKDQKEAIRLINTAFGKGFAPVSSYTNDYKTKIKKISSGKAFIDKLKRLPTSIRTIRYANRYLGREKGYAYFQDFIPENDHDIRIIVIGRRAFAIKRLVRDGDFRASGSGQFIHDPDQIPRKCITIAFELSAELKSQCMTYDFVFKGKTPLIVEISYGFIKEVYDPCPGYWDQDLNWIDGAFNAQYFMVEDFMRSLDK